MEDINNAISKISIVKLFHHRGVYFVEGTATPEYIDSLEHFPIRDDDVFLVTYPKSGTVWTQQILSLIYYEGHLKKTDNTKTIERVPWLEFNPGNMDYEQRPSPRLFTTHLPYYMAPKGLKDKKAKVLYISRNPKDNMVSQYNFYHMYQQMSEPPTEKVQLDEFMENYMTGKVNMGLWLDHVAGWCAHKDDYNILFLTYEEMVKDLRTAVMKICEFLGKKLDEQTLETIVERSTFKTMKKDSAANYDFTNEKIKAEDKGSYLRKGTIGDWKNVLTVAQNEKFDKVFQEKLKDLPIKFIWDINEIV